MIYVQEPAVKLFEVDGNYALAQIGGRRFPGLLVQRGYTELCSVGS